MLRGFSRSAAMRGDLLKLVCVVFLCVFDKTSPCLIISEVNCDNPKLDTEEFVELYYDGLNSASLDGYTLVFYNGNGDVAYRVIDLSGHHTDPRGFFLVGSSNLKPSPGIALPPNSVQNGPDAIALYGPNWTPVAEGDHVSGVGLLDAVVYTSRKSADGADGLASVLTPGSVPYVEDEKALEGDESIQRCWQSENLWTFHTGPPTPGWVNHCPSPTPGHVWINEVDIGGLDRRVLVELNVGMATESLSVVIYDASRDLVRTSVDFSAKETGIFTVFVNASSLPVALAVYKGPASDFPVDGPLSHQQPIDAFVYGDSQHMPSSNLTETLIPGRKPFILTDSIQTVGLHASRCGVAEWTRDPGMFVTRPWSPGKPNDCIWFESCPRNITTFASTGRSQPPVHSDEDFLLSEINTDSPGAAEDEEFIELWHPSGFRMSLDSIWLVMINGQTGAVYYELELNGYYTDNDGYFLIGSSKLSPDISVPPNTIQNGPDAIALYRSESPPSEEGLNIPKKGLLDAVVYRARGSDKKASELIEALTPGQLPLLEDINASPGEETLTRCGPERFNLNDYRVALPTPRKLNDCPPPPTIVPPQEGLLINELGRVPGAHNSHQHYFVELIGPPLTPLDGLVLVFFAEAKEFNVKLTGKMGNDGFYLFSNYSSEDLSFPALTDLIAVVLCFEPSGSGVCGSNSHHLDQLIFHDDQTLHSVIQYNTTQIYNRYPSDSLNSVSRCALAGTHWTPSTVTPGLQNLCPSPAFSTPVDLCLQPDSHDWHGESGDCAKERFAVLLEQLCGCGISSVHFKGVNVSCVSDGLYAQGPVLALSDQQREKITETIEKNKLSCPVASERQTNGAEASVGLQVGLVLAAVLLFALGAAVFIYLYKKRRPADYLSMQMNEQAESPLEL